MLTQIINARVLTPQGWLKDGSVIIRDNKILEVTNCDLAVIGADLIDAKGMAVVPGGHGEPQVVHVGHRFSLKGVEMCDARAHGSHTQDAGCQQVDGLYSLNHRL